MTRINLRLLLVMGVALLATGGGVHLLHGYQVQRNADAFLREARRELLAQLAICQAARDQFADAVGSLKDAVDLAPHRLEAYEQRAALQLHWLKSADDACSSMRDLVENNRNDHRAHLIRGERFREHAHDSAVQRAHGASEDLSADAARDLVLQQAADDAQTALRLAP